MKPLYSIQYKDFNIELFQGVNNSWVRYGEKAHRRFLRFAHFDNAVCFYNRKLALVKKNDAVVIDAAILTKKEEKNE